MNLSQLRPPTLHLVTDSRFPRERLLEAIEAAADNGADWVQVRDHSATADELFRLAEAVVAICHERGTRVAVNDRVDVALAAGADGVQLGGRSLPLTAVRRIAPRLQIGASVHRVEAAIAAEVDGADWVAFGHVYATSSHPGEPGRGIDLLADVARAVKMPVVAIGGIGLDQVGAVRAAGASGVAVISAILGASDPGLATRELRVRLNDGSGRDERGETGRSPSVSVILSAVSLPAGLTIRQWREEDIPPIQAMSRMEGWTTADERPEATVRAWFGSWPTLTATADGEVVGFLRAVSDGAVTTYVAELLVAPAWRKKGIARALLDVAQRLAPGSRVDLLATSASRGYYEHQVFRTFTGFRRSWKELDE